MHTVLAIAGGCFIETESSVRGVFVDANEALAVIFERLGKPGDLAVRIHRDPGRDARVSCQRCWTARRSLLSITPRCRPKSRGNVRA